MTARCACARVRLSGRWAQPEPRSPCILQADFVIVGAGITCGFPAKRLTGTGASVVVIDRHAPASGLTATSKVMLLWELDSSLLELEQRYSAMAAGRISYSVNISLGDEPKDGPESRVPVDLGLGMLARLRDAQRHAGKPFRLSQAMNVGFRN